MNLKLVVCVLVVYCVAVAFTAPAELQGKLADCIFACMCILPHIVAWLFVYCNSYYYS
jgi:hypothetical protein